MKLPSGGFKWIEQTSQFTEHFLQDNVQYPNELHLPFLPERMKIGKTEKVLANMFDKKEYVIHIRNLNHRLVSKKCMHTLNTLKKSYIKIIHYMNTELRKEAKNYFEKYFFKLMNNAVFGKTMDNVGKHRDINALVPDVH